MQVPETEQRQSQVKRELFLFVNQEKLVVGGGSVIWNYWVYYQIFIVNYFSFLETVMVYVLMRHYAKVEQLIVKHLIINPCVQYLIFLYQF